MELVSPYLIVLGEYAPGEVFPFFFTMEMFQRALLASLVVTVVSGLLGSFLLIRNLSLIGDGLAHVSFGGIAVGIVLGATAPLSYALVFSIIASIMIYELTVKRNIDRRRIDCNFLDRNARFRTRHIEGIGGRNNHGYRGISIRKFVINR